MRRNKQWWAKLTKAERIRLVLLERAAKMPACGGWNIPDDMVLCSACSKPAHENLCVECWETLTWLLIKAERRKSCP